MKQSSSPSKFMITTEQETLALVPVQVLLRKKRSQRHVCRGNSIGALITLED
jgi:hypothetical protein